jgi:hypothetical protein
MDAWTLGSNACEFGKENTEAATTQKMFSASFPNSQAISGEAYRGRHIWERHGLVPDRQRLNNADWWPILVPAGDSLMNRNVIVNEIEETQLAHSKIRRNMRGVDHPIARGDESSRGVDCRPKFALMTRLCCSKLVIMFTILFTVNWKRMQDEQSLDFSIWVSLCPSSRIKPSSLHMGRHFLS